jgi:hypothetical protein
MQKKNNIQTNFQAYTLKYFFLLFFWINTFQYFTSVIIKL